MRNPSREKQSIKWLFIAAVLFFLHPDAVRADVPRSTFESRSFHLYQINVGGGFGSLGGSTVGRLGVGLSFRPSDTSNILVDFTSGLIVQNGATGVPLLAGVSYYVNDLNSNTVWPYFGLSLGPVAGFFGTPFAFIFRPGVDIELAKSFDLNLQLPLGGIGSAFYLAPQANLIIHVD